MPVLVLIFFLITMSNVECQKQYIHSSLLSRELWTDSIKGTKLNIASSMIECGSIYSKYVDNEVCNAFSFDSSDKSCSCAKIKTLEDGQEGVENQVTFLHPQ